MIPRRKPLPQRTKPVRRVNPERRARVDAKKFGPCYELAVTLPCCGCGEPPPSAGHHVVSRGAGGRDRANVVPLCRDRIDQGEEGCHSRAHRVGVSTFWLETGVNLEAVARAIADEVERRRRGEA